MPRAHAAAAITARRCAATRVDVYADDADAESDTIRRASFYIEMPMIFSPLFFMMIAPA